MPSSDMTPTTRSTRKPHNAHAHSAVMLSTAMLRMRNFPLLVAVLFVSLLLVLQARHSSELVQLQTSIAALSARLETLPTNARSAATQPHPLIFYNKPPKTGSTTIRVAMGKAVSDAGRTAADCFAMTEWNELGYKTLLNKKDVSFYGCHTRLTPERYRDISSFRDHNVIFVTGTRSPEDIILSSYLQHRRGNGLEKMTDPQLIRGEVESFKQYVERYPVNALYKFHGGEMDMSSCPLDWRYNISMRALASRYEVVIDLTRPQESATMMQIVTGIRPDFDQHLNERTKEDTPLIKALRAVPTEHRNCGNWLVHNVLMQRFNIIKDRLMQNMCFEEGTGSAELCDLVQLTEASIVQRNREERYQERNRLLRMKAN